MFKKNVVVGVSVTPGVGLEVAQIDFLTKTVLKYGSKPLAYDYMRRDIADMDIFKETLIDLFAELDIPKGSDVVINIPTVFFNVHDYPASLDSSQIEVAVNEKVRELPLFQDEEPCYSIKWLANSTLQFNKIATCAAQKNTIIEIVLQLMSMGYNVTGIDTSVNSILNALIYKEQVDISSKNNWVLLLVEDNVCRIMLMNGGLYVDYTEERISIGEVLDEAENYSTVVSAVSPILMNIPAQYLLVVSKTNTICAQELAKKIRYSAPIIHFDANIYREEAFLPVDTSVDSEAVRTMSLDIIGAAINTEFARYSGARFNLFNESLGDLYLQTQPFEITFNSLRYVFSIPNVVKTIVTFAIICALVVGGGMFLINKNNATLQDKLSDIETNITEIEKFIKENDNVSTDLFNEGDEVKIGLQANQNLYKYYTVVGTEIPKKLWLTKLELGAYTTIEGQADNLQSVYSFYKNVKESIPGSNVKLQQLSLASKSKLTALTDEGNFDTDSIISTMNADYYQFKISDAPQTKQSKEDELVDGLPNVELLNK